MSSVIGENSAECGEHRPDRPAHMDVFFLARNVSIWRRVRCTSLSGRKAAFEERNDGKVEREAKFTEYKREIDKREKERQAASGTKKKKPNKFSVCSAALQLTPLLGKQTGNRKRNTDNQTASDILMERCPRLRTGLPRSSSHTSSGLVIAVWGLRGDFHVSSHAMQTDSVRIRVCFRLWFIKGGLAVPWEMRGGPQQHVGAISRLQSFPCFAPTYPLLVFFQGWKMTKWVLSPYLFWILFNRKVNCSKGKRFSVFRFVGHPAIQGSQFHQLDGEALHPF